MLPLFYKNNLRKNIFRCLLLVLLLIFSFFFYSHYWGDGRSNSSKPHGRRYELTTVHISLITYPSIFKAGIVRLIFTHYGVDISSPEAATKIDVIKALQKIDFSYPCDEACNEEWEFYKDGYGYAPMKIESMQNHYKDAAERPEFTLSLSNRIILQDGSNIRYLTGIMPRMNRRICDLIERLRIEEAQKFTNQKARAIKKTDQPPITVSQNVPSLTDLKSYDETDLTDIPDIRPYGCIDTPQGLFFISPLFEIHQ